MKGIVFNLLEEFICQNWGEEVFEQVLDAAVLETQEPFVGPGTYPDADLVALLTSACEILSVPAPDALRAFGKFSFPKLAGLGEQFLVGHTHPKSFLLTVHDVIHVEVRKLFEHANPPDFEYSDESEDSLTIRYRSQRKLCLFLEGLLEGLAEHFETPITHKKSSCMLDGADSCEYHLQFGAQVAAAE